ncbi:TMEM175 family protein [Latilactobacillus curvatus]|uniref:TMEM175 family protein n=1 Tax=Latilactobacillus curvatus TaxID=28038 RepID=UPI0024A895B7|nr:TMEM175 family protein [Latilactobacillus curvatus]
MNKGRLEAFSDAVIAIIVTIMILEFKTPETPEIKALLENGPYFFCVYHYVRFRRGCLV